MKITVFFQCLLVCATAMAAEPVFKHDVTSQKKPWTHENFLNSPDEFSFVIIPDRCGSERRGIFPQAVKKANMLRPEFIMTVGDLIEGQMWESRQDHEFLRGQWRELNSITSTSEAPFFHVVGNHDICRTRPGFPRANETTREVWEENCGTHTYYSFVYKNVLFICFNSMSGCDSRSPQIHITPEQLEWAKNVLKNNPDVRWTLLFMHHPNSWEQAAFKELEKELVKRDYTVFAGDWHHYVKFRRHNRNYYVLATAGGCGDGANGSIRGMEYGEFDHIAYVTVTKNGPVVANILLDGILPDDVMTFEKSKNKYGGNLSIPRNVFQTAPVQTQLKAPASDGKPWQMVLDEAVLKTCKRNGEGVWNNGVVRINGNNTPRRWERVVLPVPSPAGKKIRISAEVKAQISKGKFQLALRSSDANDTTIAYDGPFVSASQDWTTVSQVVELSKDTAFTMIYFLGLNLDGNSFAEVRNLKFEEIRNGDSATTHKVAPAPASGGNLWQMVLDEAVLKTCKRNGEGVWNNGVVRINGNNTPRRWERVVLPVPSPAGKKIRISAEVKAQISKGKFQLALRSSDANDTTIAYDGPFVSASQDWTPVSQMVELSKDTAFTMIYFLGLNLDGNSFAEVRNLKFEEIR